MIIIPDIHQDLRFVEEILSLHYMEGEEVIFLGDYFDTLRKDVCSVKEVSEFLNINYLNKDFIFLMGNHDVPYYEACALARQKGREYAHKPYKYMCSGYTNNKAKTIYKMLDPEFFRSMKLYIRRHGYTFSHAGFSPYVFKMNLNIEDNLKIWDEEFRYFHETIGTPLYSRIYQIGPSRGGRFVRAGGPLWLDFMEEFESIDGFPQVVGHTGCYKEQKDWQKGFNYCIDNGQTTYMIIEDEVIKIYIGKNIIMEVKNAFRKRD